MSPLSHVTDLHPEAIHEAVAALFKAAGSPSRSSYEPAQDQPGDEKTPFEPGSSDGGVHPVFGLLVHYRSHDDGHRGYTKNPWRGDHLSIPCWSEFGRPFVLETSFHKGDAFVERVDFPHADSELMNALSELLQWSETR